MSINSTDNKFGLPKPDFQALPKKKVIWPLLVVIAIVVLLIAAKMGYDFYFKVAQAPIPAVSANHHSTADPVTDISSASPLMPPTEVGASLDEPVQPSVSGADGFEPKKSNKIKKSISATQKELETKQNKPLVKPGTYQELKEPQGIYHLVVVSHLDKRSAMKVVRQLMKNNLGVCLVLPRVNKGEKYYRVTIGHSKTEYEAERKLQQFKSKYKNIFILAY